MKGRVNDPTLNSQKGASLRMGHPKHGCMGAGASGSGFFAERRAFMERRAADRRAFLDRRTTGRRAAIEAKAWAARIF